MEKAQVIDFESGGVKKEMVGVRAKTAANVGAGWWDRRKDVDGVARSMRGGRRRILAGAGELMCYHAMSWTVGGEVFFDDLEKEALKTLIWKLARFCRVRVLTYAVMGNHFHVLVEVPDKAKLVEEFAGPDGEQRLLTHMKSLYSAAAVRSLEAELKRMRDQGRKEDAAAVVESVITRMGDLSRYMKEVKERFTRWFNKRHGRRGTLWMDRFKSVMVENGEALQAVAQYIDLNAVRAGLVADPSEYRWCGWTEALGESRRAKRGICRVMDCALDSWERGRTDARENYAGALEVILDGAKRMRQTKPVEAGGGVDGGRSGDAAGTSRLEADCTVSDGADSVAASDMCRLEADCALIVEGDGDGCVVGFPAGGGKRMSVGSLMLKRVRYFTDGAVIGSKAFVERVYESNRGKFPEGRKHSSRPWRDPGNTQKRAEFGMHTLKDLRVDVYPE